MKLSLGAFHYLLNFLLMLYLALRTYHARGKNPSPVSKRFFSFLLFATFGMLMLSLGLFFFSHTIFGFTTVMTLGGVFLMAACVSGIQLTLLLTMQCESRLLWLVGYIIALLPLISLFFQSPTYTINTLGLWQITVAPLFLAAYLALTFFCFVPLAVVAIWQARGNKKLMRRSLIFAGSVATLAVTANLIPIGSKLPITTLLIVFLLQSVAFFTLFLSLRLRLETQINSSELN